MRLLITLTFLLLGSWFFLGSGSGRISEVERARVSRADFPRDLSRGRMPDPPWMEVAGLQMTCQECHGIFESGTEESLVREQHKNIRLEHGLNARCFNCHHRADRNFLILPGEHKLPFADVEQLCASCHGTTFRDWQKGIHGKARGSWETHSPERELMGCTECHDPHHPAFRPIAPLPPPSTWRMRATQSDPAHDVHSEHNPLRQRAPHDATSQLKEQH